MYLVAKHVQGLNVVIVTLPKGGSGNRNDGMNKEIIVTLKMEGSPKGPLDEWISNYYKTYSNGFPFIDLR